ncbi:hypothetical protein BAUCODRAFT_27724 [Baudoinia panamericana UAMH 10762]|uniref:DUF7908 domain-containing protein n=1 Tax=Baudoinia panamericana (strain UAMH 10762) TaxID=717646 RepID=M2N0J0_BAUPA|nr:uncharacterized protein BAUCODRAFT_27724 [Baudoinia panamericana UAMH 10762]EMC92444.1 hypothetical protein BAUCODRAFT_27724 [Baudoinia panamericana UAMH 10762]
MIDVVYEQAISINTNVRTNTTFHPIPEVAVTISNAPTSVDGVTTFRYTQPRTSTHSIGTSQSSSTSWATPTMVLNSFVLMVTEAHFARVDGGRIHRRQSGDFFIGSNGTVTNDCTLVPVYTVTNGMLAATDQGVTYTYSTSPGTPYELFAPSTIPGSITTTFSLGPNSVLNWQNDAFWNGQAQFCSVWNGTIYAVFRQNAPDGCTHIDLQLFTVSSCQALALSTITGPTG